MLPLPFASVIVCTRNRAPVLAQSVAAMLELDYPADRWELLIVDNGSTDTTPEVARRAVAPLADRGRVIRERRPRLSSARNTGVRAARGRIIAFLDDDAFVGPDWLRALAEALGDANTLAVGGPVEPWFQGELPDWFADRYLPYLSAWDRGPEPQLLTYNDYPRGNNMAFRAEAFERFGEFSLHLGRRPRSLLSCEETEFCLRIERAGGRIAYVPGARVRHLTDTERLTTDWLERRFHAQGWSEAILEWRHAGWEGLRLGRHRWELISTTDVELQLFDSALGETMFRRCVRQGFLGYCHGLLTAPQLVPGYRPPGGGFWRPPYRPGSLARPAGPAIS